MTLPQVERRLAAILIADVVGYSRLVEADEAGTLAAMKHLRHSLLEPLMAEHRGRIVKLMGDGLIAEFASVVDAVACAAAVQTQLAKRDEPVSAERRLTLRIGVNVGDVVVEGDDLLGDGVNVAARLEELCPPGGVLISGTAHDQLPGKLDVRFEFAGEQHLKNIARPWRVYQMVVPGVPSALPQTFLSDKPAVAVLPLENMSDDDGRYKPGASFPDVVDPLRHARECYGRREWADAFDAFSLAESAAPLAGDDLELLAMSAYLADRDEKYLAALERAYQAHLASDQCLSAVRCAFWLGLRLLFRGETAHGAGWFARARRLLDGEKRDCVEQGYMLLPTAEQEVEGGNFETAYSLATDAAAIGDRFGDADLVACARHLQGRALIRQAKIDEGLRLLDEVMVAASAHELSPIMTGLIYCSVIDACQQIWELARVREWTSDLAEWCDAQPQMVAFSGICLVHRAEIMRINGAWQKAIGEAQRAYQRFSCRDRQKAAAAALYQQAEVHRLRGEFGLAEEAYRNAGQWGWDPQPGLALLRMAQGRIDDAVAGIRRKVAATTDQLDRARVLPAHVEITLAAGDIQEARGACSELSETAEWFGTSVLSAMAAETRGALELAEGDMGAALLSLRPACTVWQDLGAPYAAARVRVLIGMACRAVGDSDGAEIELSAARAVFLQLGAKPDLAHVDKLARLAPSDRQSGLTAREMQVLRLIAAGKSNKIIARELSLSEKTINRHASNIFNKLDVPTRAAATAYAYEHGLI